MFKNIWKATSFARGAIAAITTVAFVDSFLGLGRVEFLDLTHAIIARWDSLLLRALEKITIMFPNLSLPNREGANLLALAIVFTPFVIGIAVNDYRKGHMGALGFRLGMFTTVYMAAWSFPAYDSKSWLNSYHISGFVTLLMIAAFAAYHIVRKRSSLETNYSFGLYSATLFIATLELLHFIPAVAYQLKDFVNDTGALEQKMDEPFEVPVRI